MAAVRRTVDVEWTGTIVGGRDSIAPVGYEMAVADTRAVAPGDSHLPALIRAHAARITGGHGRPQTARSTTRAREVARV